MYDDDGDFINEATGNEDRRIEVEVDWLASAGYRAFVRARLGARKALEGDGPHLDDLILDFEALDQNEKDVWCHLAARVFALCGEMDGKPFKQIAQAAALIWEEITGLPGKRVFQGPALVGLDAFCRTIAAFLDQENDRRDIEELCAGNYDWIRWGKSRQEQANLCQ